MENPIDPSDWHLELNPLGGPARILGIEDVRSLPRQEETIDFKCVEGWSTVTQFAGARLSDFTARFAPGSEKAGFIGMVTPSKDYYVGVDMPSALHPQTLLAYEMNGKPLEDRHGAPLRLVMPVNTGSKISNGSRGFFTRTIAPRITGLNRATITTPGCRSLLRQVVLSHHQATSA